MRDPYLYDDVPVLKNKLDIKQQSQLDDAESDYVVYRLKDLAMNPLPGSYHTEHFLAMHEFIFQDIYAWAGVPRTIAICKEEDILGGQSIEYSDPFDIISDIHHVLSDMRAKPWQAMDIKQRSTEFCDSPVKKIDYTLPNRYIITAVPKHPDCSCSLVQALFGQLASIFCSLRTRLFLLPYQCHESPIQLLWYFPQHYLNF